LQAHRNQVENAVRERNEAQARMMQMTRERDEAMRLAENREAARVKLELCSMLILERKS